MNDAPYPPEFPGWSNLATLMFDCARARGDHPALWGRRGGAWVATSWTEVGARAASLARALRRAGVDPGDRVLIVSENRPEWPVADTAIMAISAITVPTYVTNTQADHAHIIRDSGARVAIVSTAALATRVAAGAREAGGLDVMIVMEPVGALDGVATVIAFEDAAGDGQGSDDMAAEAALIPTERTACIIYTSGTGGAPKGVMLPHRSMLSNCRGAYTLLRPLRLRDEIYLSFLPLSHSFEHTCGQFFLLALGCQVHYSAGADRLVAEMAEVRPTAMTGVPRLFEVIRGRVLAQVAREQPWRQRLFHWALASGGRRVDGTLSLLDRLADPILDRLVRAKVRARFGGRLKGIMSGGARLDPEVGRFFLSLGIPVLQGYGQTEAGPVVSANPPDAIRIDTVGLVLPGVDLRIAGDGEIEVRGDLVMQGYWGNAEATQAAMNGEWLRTGDVGTLDPDGYLRITDRKKDFLKTAGGEMISPAKIEGLLMAHGAIAQAVVAGDGQAHLAGLIVAAEGADEKAVGAAVDAVNKVLPAVERVRRWRAVPAFTVENGLLTATQKIKRRAVVAEHASLVAGMYR